MKLYQINGIDEMNGVICYGEYDSYEEAYKEYVKLGGLEDKDLRVDEIDDTNLEDEE